MLALIYEDFRADNAGTLERVLRFLGVDRGTAPAPREANPSVALRAPRLSAALRSLERSRGPVARAARSGVTAMTPRAARRRALTLLHRRVLYGQPPAVQERVMLALRRRYRPEVASFGDYIDRDLLSFWGYERLGDR